MDRLADSHAFQGPSVLRDEEVEIRPMGIGRECLRVHGDACSVCLKIIKSTELVGFFC